MRLNHDQLKALENDRVDLEWDADLEVWTFNENGEGLEMSGRIDRSTGVDIAIVEKIRCGGDFSGCMYEDHLIPLIEASGASLRALEVWERGDCVRILVATKGVVEYKEIDY